MTILFNTANEIEEIKKIVDKHSLASEAKINEDKTQVFIVGRLLSNKPDSFKQIVHDNVKILELLNP